MPTKKPSPWQLLVIQANYCHLIEGVAPVNLATEQVNYHSTQQNRR